MNDLTEERIRDRDIRITPNGGITWDGVVRVKAKDKKGAILEEYVSLPLRMLKDVYGEPIPAGETIRITIQRYRKVE